MDLDYQEIGRNIRRFRQAKGLKQKELAELIQVSDQHVSHIENATPRSVYPHWLRLPMRFKQIAILCWALH